MAEYSYDAWGRLRNPQTLEPYEPDSEPNLLLGRGYTGHEHLTWFGLVNMNARLYDPVLGRFLSPDPYVQLPDYTQNFNRYSYCWNNPLLYTDESGEVTGVEDAVAALIGGVCNLVGNLIAGNVHSFGEGAAYFGWGALAGTAFIYTGPAGSGAILATGNSLTGQVAEGGWSNVSFNQTFSAAILGAAAGQLGSQLTPMISGYVGSILGNGVAAQVFSQTIASGVTGFGIGTGSALLNNFSLEDALKIGFNSGFNGAITGAISAGITQYLNWRGSLLKSSNGNSNINGDESLTQKSQVSPNVQKALETLEEIKSEGGTVRVNPLGSDQELNMTIQHNGVKLDMRIETHPIPQKYGGDNVTPMRHLNLDIKPKPYPRLPYNGHKLLP